jgi:hypothetical protein
MPSQWPPTTLWKPFASYVDVPRWQLHSRKSFSKRAWAGPFSCIGHAACSVFAIFIAKMAFLLQREMQRKWKILLGGQPFCSKPKELLGKE